MTLNVIIATVMLYETKDITITEVLEKCKKIYKYMMYCKIETNMTLEPQQTIVERNLHALGYTFENRGKKICIVKKTPV